MRLAEIALLWYARRVPPHRGKWWVVRQLLPLASVSPGGETVERRGGLLWSLDPSDYVCGDVFWCGEKDPWEIWHLQRLTPASGPCVFLDVGANFGYYSLRLAHQAGCLFHAYAFEPNPPSFERLQRNISLNSSANVKAFRMGLSDRPGSLSIEAHPANSGAARLVERAGDIPVSTLDDFVESHGLTRVDLIKIDVEGYEERVLAGGRRTFGRFHPHLLLEINPPSLDAAGSAPAHLMSMVESFGYRIQEIDRRRLRPLVHAPQGEDYVNVLCSPVHPSRS